jgi:DNA-binding HxlR family transcriptional regulator
VREAGRSGCPVNLSLEIFGDRWTLLVIRDIMFSGRRRFREILVNSDERIASNILAARLRHLVESGLLTKDDDGSQPQVVYSLTEQAIALVPVFAAIDAWGIKYLATSPAMAAPAQVVADGGPEVWGRLMDELRAIHLRDRPLPAVEDSVLQEMGVAALGAQE